MIVSLIRSRTTRDTATAWPDGQALLVRMQSVPFSVVLMVPCVAMERVISLLDDAVAMQGRVVTLAIWLDAHWLTAQNVTVRSVLTMVKRCAIVTRVSVNASAHYRWTRR